MIITDGHTSMGSHTLLPLSSLTTSIPYFVNEFYMLPLSTQVIVPLDKEISMVTKLWGGVKPHTKVAKPPKFTKLLNLRSSHILYSVCVLCVPTYYVHACVCEYVCCMCVCFFVLVCVCMCMIAYVHTYVCIQSYCMYSGLF